MAKRAYEWRGKWALLLSMAATSSALATTYTFSRDGQSDVPVCRAVQQALSRGLILDAEKPLCYRRFEVSPKAVRYGFTPIDFTPVPASRYRSLLSEMVLVSSNRRMPLTDAQHRENEASVKRLMGPYLIKLYQARFDNDNSGMTHVVYAEDSMLCPSGINAPLTTNPIIFMENVDGTMNKSWGVRDETSGSPFIYKGQTYYVRWTSLIGAALKNAWAQLDIYYDTPDLPGSPPKDYEVFSPPDCTIYQMKKGIR